MVILTAVALLFFISVVNAERIMKVYGASSQTNDFSSIELDEGISILDIKGILNEGVPYVYESTNWGHFEVYASYSGLKDNNPVCQRGSVTIIDDKGHKYFSSEILCFTQVSYGDWVAYLFSGPINGYYTEKVDDYNQRILNQLHGNIMYALFKYNKTTGEFYYGAINFQLIFDDEVDYESLVSTLGSLNHSINNISEKFNLLQLNQTNQNQRISNLETWKQTIIDWKQVIDSWKSSTSTSITDIIASISGLTTKSNNHELRITSLENQTTSEPPPQANGTSPYLKYLGTSDRKNMLCGYAEDNKISSISDLGLNCTLTYRTSFLGRVSVSCRCK